METSTAISLVAAIGAVVSAVAASFSARASTRSSRLAETSLEMSKEHSRQSSELSKEHFKQSTELTKDIFKRQGVIDLHMAWQDIHGIDPNNLITPHVVRAVNTLGLTAALWNHDVVDRNILYQQYWSVFRSLYDTLNSITNVIPGLNQTGRDLLTPEIRRAYDEMHSMEVGSVKVSRI
jgi:hypothetical protein